MITFNKCLSLCLTILVICAVKMNEKAIMFSLPNPGTVLVPSRLRCLSFKGNTGIKYGGWLRLRKAFVLLCHGNESFPMMCM